MSNSFESLIRASIPVIKERFGVLLWFVNVPTRHVFTGKRYALIRSGKAEFDLHGVRKPDGRAVGIELKQNESPQTSIHLCDQGQDAAGIEWHQAEALLAMRDAGGLALVLWANGASILAIRPWHIANARSKGAKSINAGLCDIVGDFRDLRTWRIPFIDVVPSITDSARLAASSAGCRARTEAVEG